MACAMMLRMSEMLRMPFKLHLLLCVSPTKDAL